MPTSLSMIIGIVFAINFTAAMVDGLLSATAVRNWQDLAKDWWLKLGEMDWSTTLESASVEFEKLFDAIYGDRIFSRKRIVRSILSSLFAITIISLLVGLEETYLFRRIRDTFEYFSVFEKLTVTYVLPIIAVPFFLNIIVDVISLQETKMVLSLVRMGRQKRISILIVVDLILTTAIFLFGWFLLYVFYFGDPSDAFPEFFKYGTEISAGGVFLYSTYFTSVIWYLFLIMVVFVKITDTFSSVVRLILSKLAETEKPAQLCGALLSVVVILGYSLTVLVELAINDGPVP